jgi:cholesterol oxidase
MSQFSRREFLRAGAVGVGVAASDLRAWAQNSDFIEALVIGSGFGGAIAALRLGQAGVDTLVLERGRRWTISAPNKSSPNFGQDTFATFDKPDGRSSWLSDMTTSLTLPFPGFGATPIPKYTGVLELIQANGMEVRTGAGVGGSSLAFNAIFLQPRRELFEAAFPDFIDYDEMDQIYYPRVRSIIKPSTIPADILATDFYTSTRTNLEQAQRATRSPLFPPNYSFFQGKLVEYAIDWDVVRQEIAGNSRPSAIDGQSWYGLNSGAKKSVDRNYLAMAEATKKVEVMPLTVVTDIFEYRPARLYFVSANQIDTNGAIVSRRIFACKHLFMAAGSMGTSALLVKAKAKGTLPRLNKWVGQNWGSNGDLGVVRGGLGDNKAGTGGPAGHFLAEDLQNPFSPTALVELVTPKNLAPAGAAVNGISVFIQLGLAPPIGSFAYNPATDSATLTWPSPSDPRLGTFLNGAQSMLDTLDKANPGTQTFPKNPATTAHPVGGAVLGKVCGLHGQVIDHPGLYVVDGSFVPGGTVGDVNPSFTIAALAERSVERIIAKNIMDKSPDDESLAIFKQRG